MQSLFSFLNIFSGDMFFHVLIIGLFYVFLFFGQNLGEMRYGTTEVETSILFQTPLGAQLGLGTQPFYEAIEEIIDKMNWLELLA